MSNISPPSTYAQWVSLLDMLKQKTDDANVLAALKKGEISWQAGVAERFTKKLVETINSRMNAASDKFQKDMSRTNGQEGAIVQAVLSLRKEMSFLLNAIDLPVIPEKDRAQYRALVQDQANKMQASLENSAKADRSGKMSSIIRNHKVNAI